MAIPFAYTPRLQPGRHRIEPSTLKEFSQPFETTYIDQRGKLVTVPPHTPRFENGALLIERASINLFTSPEDLTHAAWLKPDYTLPGMAANLLPGSAEEAGSGGGWTKGVNLTRVGVTTGPTGLQDAVVYSSASAASSSLSKAINLAPNTAYKFAVWVRLMAGDAPSTGHIARVTTDVASGAGALAFSDVELPSGWRRFFFAFTTGPAAAAATFELGANWANGAEVAFASPVLVSVQGVADTADVTLNDPIVTTPDGRTGALKVERGAVLLSQITSIQVCTNYATSIWVFYPEGPSNEVLLKDGFSTERKAFSASEHWQRLALDVFTKTGDGATITFERSDTTRPLWIWWPQIEPGFPSEIDYDADVVANGGTWEFIGQNITRVGTTVSPAGTNDAVVYQSNTSGNNFIGREVELEPGQTYRFSVWTKLISGAAPNHRACLILDSSNDEDPNFASYTYRDVNAAPPSGTWVEQEVFFRAGARIKDSFAYMAVDWESGAQIAYWRPSLNRVTGVEVTSLMRTQRANDVAYVAEYVDRVTPALQPLRQSHEANQLEAELKALFTDMLNEFVRPGERMVNTAGIPHIGEFEQVEMAVKADGLALQRRGANDAMRYVFRSWRARNPKRGLHMLRTYLQLLWPNGWQMSQLWADGAQVYPTVLSETQQTGYFLTSRVRVQISSAITDGSDVAAVAPSLRSVVPARIVLEVLVLTTSKAEMGVAIGAVGSQFHSIEGLIY